MTLRSVLIVSLVTLLLGLGTGYGIRSYTAAAQSTAHELADLQAKYADQTDYINRFTELSARAQDLQNQLTQLDTTKTKALSDALTTNASLSSSLAVAQRMRLTGTTCPQSGTSSSQASGPGSLGDAAGVELSTETRHAVFDLRADIISDREKLDYLQGYVRALGLSPPHTP
ncbi:lysis system i-spanin subunit Rz [Dyella sp. ASV21]|uniref:lysis system i-spanin subunit Rz n=1 Tax=Dyella sp. ASV21 TaxID=2795114 RepID=UPI0027151ADF|nr:lysis system i-spanin subunit Rz [Dyella sp. ASV21]